jgi:hypothetical protein
MRSPDALAVIAATYSALSAVVAGLAISLARTRERVAKLEEHARLFDLDRAEARRPGR